MADRKWKEGKQQPSMLLGSAVPGSSLVSFYFLCPQAVDDVDDFKGDPPRVTSSTFGGDCRPR